MPVLRPRSAAPLAVLVAAMAAGPAPGQIKIFGRTTVTTEAKPAGANTDAEALAAAGLKADDPAGLIGYFKIRTLTDDDIVRIRAVIKRMGDEAFEERIKAASDAEKLGPAAVAPLRAAALADPDPEVQFRAGETLRRMEKVSHTRIATAAARALAKANVPDGPRALLGYLPTADTPAVEEEIRTSLVALAVRDGKPDAALVEALKDASPVRRGAAAIALIEGGPAGANIRIPSVYPQVKAVVLAEKDPDTRFRLLFSLLRTAKDADAVPELIAMIPDAPRGRLWMIEDYLIQLAGPTPPKIKTGGTKDALAKTRTEWADWWKVAQTTVKLDAFVYKPQTTGSLILVSMDPRGYGNGKIAELGPDMKAKWTLNGINAPAEAKVLPNGRIMVLEQNNYRITERDTDNRILVTRGMNGPPVGMQVLENGNTVVTLRQMVTEYDKDWKQIKTFNRNNGDVLAAHRMANGKTFVMTQPGMLLQLDDKMAEVPDPWKLGQPFYQCGFQVLADDRVLVTEQSRVVEYQLLPKGEKKEVWKYTAAGATSVQRLPNGNTLLVESNANTLKEITPTGEVAWVYSPTDGMRLMRAERR